MDIRFEFWDTRQDADEPLDEAVLDVPAVPRLGEDIEHPGYLLGFAVTRNLWVVANDRTVSVVVECDAAGSPEAKAIR